MHHYYSEQQSDEILGDVLTRNVSWCQSQLLQMFSTFKSTDNLSNEMTILLAPPIEEEPVWKSALRRISNATLLPGISEMFTPGPPPAHRRRYTYHSSSGESTSGGDDEFGTEDLLSDQEVTKMQSVLSFASIDTASRSILQSEDVPPSPASRRGGRRLRLNRCKLASVRYPHTHRIPAKHLTDEKAMTPENVIKETTDLIRDLGGAVDRSQDPVQESMYWMAFVSDDGDSESSITGDEDQERSVPAYRRSLQRTDPPTSSPTRYFIQRPSVDPGDSPQHVERIPPPTRAGMKLPLPLSGLSVDRPERHRLSSLATDSVTPRGSIMSPQTTEFDGRRKSYIG